MASFREALLLLVLTASSLLAFELRGRVPFTSDQSVVALMAEEIRERGVHPIFYYGAEYAGTLETHYVAAVFSLFGASPRVFRGAMTVLLVLVTFAVSAVARTAFGARAGLFAGLYLAVGPSFFFEKGSASDGAYTSLLLLSATSLWLALLVEGRFAESRPASALLLGLGLSLGLAWWVHSPSVFLAPVVAAAALVGTTRRWLSVRTVGLLSLGFLVGSAPWWVRNLETGMGSLRSAEMAPSSVGRLASQAASLFRDGWSRVLGGGSAGSSEATFPYAPVLAIGLLALLVAFGCWCAVRGSSPPVRLGALVCVVALASLSALCLAVARTDFSEPRYLFAAYAAVAPLVGGLLSQVWRWPAVRVLLIATIAALNLGSQARAPLMKHHDAATPFYGEFDLAAVIERLEMLGVRHLYTSYWFAYRIAFLSEGKVSVTPFGSGLNGFTRVPWLKAAVDGSAAPAFLLTGDDRQDFHAFLASHGFEARREALEGFALFTDLPPEALRLTRFCQCIPATVRPGDVVLVDATGAERLAVGGMAPFRVTLRNNRKRPLSTNVSLSYHWLREDGSVVLWDGERASPIHWPVAGAQSVVEIGVRANVPPGTYALTFDLVDEGVAWLGAGGSPLVRRIVVEPAPR
jgi:4-amino-4-deoxy-L-arabinose transferase-like glycosyltransferase